MANVERELPLFPLGGTVLFPGMNLPLQIFENRYLQMMADITQDDSRFGVVRGAPVSVSPPLGVTAAMA